MERGREQLLEIRRPTQLIPASIGCRKKRPSANVSAVADPYTGVLTYETYPNTKGYST